MAISFIGSAANSADNGADVSLTLPGGMQQNDLVIVTCGIGGAGGIDRNMVMLTSGYGKIADLFSNDSRDTNCGVFYKFMPATPDTTARVEGFGTVDNTVSAACMVFRGVDTTTPFDVTSTTATGISTMHPNPPSIDHLNPSGLWTVVAGASGHGVGAQTYTFPTGYTTNAVNVGRNGAVDSNVGMGYRTNPADPEDPGVMTLSGADNTAFSWCAVTMALRPAVPLSATIGQVTETDAAQTVAWAPKRRLLNQAADSETAQSMTRRKALALAQVVDTQASQVMTPVGSGVLLQQVSESETAQAMTRRKALVLVQAADLHTSQPMTRLKQRGIQQASESDTAPGVLVALKRLLLQQVVETETAQAMTRRKVLTVQQAMEVDVALALRILMWNAVTPPGSSWTTILPDGTLWSGVTPSATTWS